MPTISASTLNLRISFRIPGRIPEYVGFRSRPTQPTAHKLSLDELLYPLEDLDDTDC